ncbi:MAG: aspartate-semialdehyde dehydrogenase [Chloroflexi bacterium]|nr:aspartate-semialdehyde dehydrogenase [Chloroflexota bacterium]MCI0802766.1 aspartate-semialdehyde dehydrogenase [Chloroflexota bacterium]MCI0829690.1 aspartate-semialdehyde dehydrogenase [Chloroflexota bacterium]MCI0864581.1 aspartate-semialdehyde dehydrogenase [Chloroflexota bacterium]MCI0898969.1 aspartate-semialdehyde dehydrogenase [Chloroflexota bacterium]
MQDLTIAVVGATGAVGAEFLRIVETRYSSLPKLKLLASSRSAGKRISVGGKDLIVEEATEKSFDGVDVAFISASAEVSRRLGPAAVAAGAVVIDDGSAFRMEDTVPLVVPEVNGADVEWHQGIISIPNCSTTPLVMAAHPLHRANPIKRIIADTYQSVSGAGGGAMADLREQSERLLDADSNTSKSGEGQIAYNVIPQIDRFLDTGYTFEEQKMRQESQKILHAPEIQISATCVRVPVYISHSASVHIEFTRPMPVDEARELLRAMPGVTVLDNPEAGEYPMPWDVAGEDDVFVGRIRQDLSHPNGLVLWIVSDNLRKGAALNSLQIAEELVSRGRLKPKHTSGVTG